MKTNDPVEIGLKQVGLTTKVFPKSQSSYSPAASLNFKHILQPILEQMKAHVESDACAVFLLSDDIIRVAASQGFEDHKNIDSYDFHLEDHPELKSFMGSRKEFSLNNSVDFLALVNEKGGMNLNACLTTRLHYREETIGLLVMFKEEPNYYKEEDADLPIIFASYASTVIENAELDSETRWRAKQLEIASQVSKKVASILEIKDLLSEVVRLIEDKFGYYHVQIFLVDGHSNEIVLRECSGHAQHILKSEGLRLKIGKQGITGWAAHTGQTLVCDDVTQEPRYHPHELLPETRSEAAIPLRVGDVVLGVLDIQSLEFNAFHQEDITALSILADQVAIAIENTHLFQETTHQFNVMRILHDISLDVTSQFENEEAIHTILEQAVKLLKVKSGSLAIYDPEIDRVQIIGGYPYPEKFLGTEIKIGEGAIGRVMETKEAVMVNDYPNWNGKSKIFRDAEYDAILSVPLRWQGEVFGVLSVGDIGDRRPFTQEDLQLISLFADLASISFKNAEIHSEEVELSQKLEKKVKLRTKELSLAREDLAEKAIQLQRLIESMVGIQEEERSRIARDLHDGINQLITGTLFEIQAAQQGIMDKRGGDALEKLDIVKDLLRRIESENRNMIFDLRPIILDTQGLVPALKQYAVSFNERFSIDCGTIVFGQPRRLSLKAETAIYRIVLESLNNVASHAQAKTVKIQINFGFDKLNVVVGDDGIGFDPKTIQKKSPGRIGLSGLVERALSIGGKLEIRSKPNEGVQIEIEVPYLETIPT